MGILQNIENAIKALFESHPTEVSKEVALDRKAAEAPERLPCVKVMINWPL